MNDKNRVNYTISKARKALNIKDKEYSQATADLIGGLGGYFADTCLWCFRNPYERCNLSQEERENTDYQLEYCIPAFLKCVDKVSKDDKTWWVMQ